MDLDAYKGPLPMSMEEHGGWCDKVVAVLGDDLTYPCKLEAGHAGRCEPDYDAGS